MPEALALATTSDHSSDSQVSYLFYQVLLVFCGSNGPFSRSTDNAPREHRTSSRTSAKRPPIRFVLLKRLFLIPMADLTRRPRQIARLLLLHNKFKPASQ